MKSKITEILKNQSWDINATALKILKLLEEHKPGFLCENCKEDYVKYKESWCENCLRKSMKD